MKRVFVAMSGGVDSSVAVLLLKREGYDVVGVFMRCYNLDGCAEQDAEDARRVAEHVGVPFYVWDFEEEYKKRVVDYMVEGYRQGITPNPDVMCNKEIKFGLFLEKALAAGADYVATGHYARLNRTASRKQHNFLPARKFASPSARHRAHNIRLCARTKLLGLPGLDSPSRRGGRDAPQDKAASPAFSSRSGLRKEYFALLEAKDLNKDQSYFLWTLTQEQLRRCLFPIGDYLKPEVRAIARKAGLSTADKKDSRGICFLGKVALADFLKRYIPEKRGAVLLALSGVEGTTYKKVGQHPGAEFFTIGQRHLGIKYQVSGVKRGGDAKPFYVAEKNVGENTLVVAEGNEHPSLYKKEVSLAGVNFISGVNPAIAELTLPASAGAGLPVFARVRYRQPLARAMLLFSNSHELENKAQTRLIFEKPQKFVAPGQSAVFYDRQGRMLGGGVIV